MQFAKRVFLMSGVLGVLMIVPLYFFERKTGEDYPPAINHPEFYYGFLGVTLAWQVMFILIGSDPVRYRPAMLPAMLEKIGFVLAVPILYALDRIHSFWLGPAAFDATWLILFILAYFKTPPARGATPVNRGLGME